MDGHGQRWVGCRCHDDSIHVMRLDESVTNMRTTVWIIVGSVGIAILSKQDTVYEWLGIWRVGIDVSVLCDVICRIAGYRHR